MSKVIKIFYEWDNQFLIWSLNLELSRGKVSASMMYSVARFNAWVSACGWSNAAEMGCAKVETLEYFVDEFRKMLNENLDDYIKNFDSYMKQKK